MSRRSCVWTLTTWMSAVGLVLALSGAPAVAQTTPVDPFATHREIGDGFSIRFKDGARLPDAGADRDRARIRRVLRDQAGLGDVSVDIRTERRGHAWSRDRPGFDDSLDGGVTCDGRAPAVMSHPLNDALRFDVPGHYRVFVRSRHLIHIGNSSGEPETSNILAFRILDGMRPGRRVSRSVGPGPRQPGNREAIPAAFADSSWNQQAGAMLARELREIGAV